MENSQPMTMAEKVIVREGSRVLSEYTMFQGAHYISHSQFDLLALIIC